MLATFEHVTHIEKDAISGKVLEILESVTSDGESGFAGAIGPETCLSADLAFASFELVQLATAIEEIFDRPSLPFHRLFIKADGSYISDLRVSELVDFLYTALNAG